MTIPFRDARAADLEFLQFEDVDANGRGRFVVAPHLSRPDRKLFGGTGIAVSLAAIEGVTGSRAIWATAQLVSTAGYGETVDVQADVLARGRRVSQVRVTATDSNGDIVFVAVGAAAEPRSDGMSGTLEAMPEVLPPSEGEIVMADDGRSGGIGWHVVAELRRAHIVEHPDRQPGRICLWTRLRRHPHITPVALAFMADVVPISIAKGCGFTGAGTSLDNTLRCGAMVESEWVLMDIRGHQASGGYGQGSAHIWAQDGTLLGTASQTVSMRAFDFDPLSSSPLP